MDDLLTLSSPRSTSSKCVYAHKRPARGPSASPRATPSVGLSPRPPPARSGPRIAQSHGPSAHSTPRGRAASSFENFRSVSVLEEIVRVETVNTESTMNPEEAFQLLHQLMPQIQSRLPQNLSHHQLLDGLESACWRKFASASPTKPTRRDPHWNQIQQPRGLRVAVRYTQLYHGVMESIRDKEMAIQRLEAKLRETATHTNELPRRIKSCEQEITKTIASFVALSARSLDCVVQRNRAEFGKNVLSCDVNQAQLVEKVKERIATLRRRKDLRLWACAELRATINDHLTRASELKKEITVVLSEVKKEEIIHKVKTKRMEDAMVGMVTAPNARKNSMCGTVATKVLVSGGLAAVATAASLPSCTEQPTIALNERLSHAHDRRSELKDEIAKLQERVRKRTEEIFDVRNEVKTLETEKADIQAQTEALEVELMHIQRACTPRPDWEELQRAVTVTTAADLLGKTARMSLQSRERREPRGELDVEDEEYTACQLKSILTSTWTTVEKVDALAGELARIRARYHGGDEITAERAKLEQLHKEIQKTLEQLATMRALASRGGAGVSHGGMASRESTDD